MTRDNTQAAKMTVDYSLCTIHLALVTVIRWKWKYMQCFIHHTFHAMFAFVMVVKKIYANVSSLKHTSQIFFKLLFNFTPQANSRFTLKQHNIYTLHE